MNPGCDFVGAALAAKGDLARCVFAAEAAPTGRTGFMIREIVAHWGAISYRHIAPPAEQKQSA
ncbi:MAG TPA: hypothetical protein VJ572_06995, partial [Azonexus sp.]|nr:hypothetical protein [Azonexus sp.]